MIPTLRRSRHKPIALLAIWLVLLTNTACAIEAAHTPATQATQDAIFAQSGQAIAAAQTSEAHAGTSIARVESIGTTIAASSTQLDTAVARLQPSVVPPTAAPPTTTTLSPTEILPQANGELHPLDGGVWIAYRDVDDPMTYPVDDLLVYRSLGEMEQIWRNDGRWAAITITLRMALIQTAQASREYSLISIAADQPDPDAFPQARPTAWTEFGIFARLPDEGQIASFPTATPSPGGAVQTAGFRSSLIVEVGEIYSIVTSTTLPPANGAAIGTVLGSIPNGSLAARLLLQVSAPQPSSLLIVFNQDFPAGGDPRKRWCSQGYRYRLWMCRR